jgi:hypothetical protein
MSGPLLDLWRGTLLALLVAAGSFLLAHYAFGRLYYLSVLLPAATMALLLLAWLLHLRADGFFRGTGSAPAARLGTERRPSGRLYAAFEEDILERSVPESTWDFRAVQHVLLWASAELGLLSIALYHWAGTGARLFR